MPARRRSLDGGKQLTGRMDPSMDINATLGASPFNSTFDPTGGAPGPGGGGLPFLNWGEPIEPVGSASSRALTPGMLSGNPGLPAVNPATSTGSSWVSKLFGKGGLDPTALVLGGLSLFGGEEPSFQPRETYAGQGKADPVASLTQALEMIESLASGMSKRGPITLGSSMVAAGPSPVSVPGVPFQIGGGLGTDPALRNTDLLTFPRVDPGFNFGGQTGQGSSLGQSRSRQGQASGQAKRRTE